MKKSLEHFEALYPVSSREDEIKGIFSFINKGTSVQVVGLPGSGRSNLLGILPYNKALRIHHLGDKEKWLHFVYMDMSEIKSRNLYDVTKFILISLSYSLNERELHDEYQVVNAFLKEALELRDEMVVFQALKKSIDFLAIQKELTIIMLFDRFDQYIPTVEEQFFANLRILRNRAKYRFSSVFSLSRPLEDLLDSTLFAPFYEYVAGNVVYTHLKDESMTLFRISYLENAVKKHLDQKTKDELFTLTGWHGKITMNSYEALISEGYPKEPLSSFLLLNKQVRAALFEIWQSLHPEEQLFLRNKNENADQKIISHLTKIGLLTNGGKITIPLFEQFIKSVTPIAQKLHYDPNRNEILMGEKALSEQLSASEFRLLRFLMQNEGRVCEKDEIIASVWKDDKTQEGVTDQALDQIIYRLRKKIEVSPNSPSFIITVKGQGYKFVS